MALKNIAKEIKEAKENIYLVYAFNATGKTRLSTAYKEIARNADTKKQTGVYYNAYSEDLFVWNNDIEHAEANIRLEIIKSSLNDLHSYIDEAKVREKLEPYNPKFDFEFHSYDDNPADGIEYITFHLKADEDATDIKISRGEERIFIWCFFLALFDSEGWDENQNEYFFIDDPVSSLDDNNLFITIFTLLELIEKHFSHRKIIITTHHIGFATVINDYLTKGEKASKYNNKKDPKYKIQLLEYKDGNYGLINPKNDVLLYHLRLLQIIDLAIKNDELDLYHMAMMRQMLENISSFLGTGQLKYTLKVIGFDDTDRTATIINALTHQNVYYPQSAVMVEDNKAIVREIFEKLMRTFQFVLHV